MKILITGCDGQVGWELLATLQIFGTVIPVNRQQCDLNEPASIIACISHYSPDIIVNAAAYTAVDKAETEKTQAFAVNAEAPAVMAKEMKKRGGLLMHFSTDYVFNGAQEKGYSETDKVAPLNVYGESKLAGEENIRDSGVDYLILRTSWVYASRAHNFMKTILRLATEREELNIVGDQIGSPTWARLIAEASAQIIGQSWRAQRDNAFQSACYHLTSAGKTSWHGFAEAIVELARAQGVTGLKVKQIHSIPSSAYPTPAKRPMNSTMDVSALQQAFNLHMPDWRDSLQICMRELKVK